MSQQILYVEDNPADVFLLTQAVRQLDSRFKVVAVMDGESALAWLKRTDVCPCLIVTDMNLPGMDGTEVLKSVRANPDLRSVPTILFADQTTRQMARNKGAIPDLFLIKPMELAGYSSIARAILTLALENLRGGYPLNQREPFQPDPATSL